MECIKKKKPSRSYSGINWRTNAANKKRLVIDFHHRCAYCDDNDIYFGGFSTFHVEHFVPKEKYRDLEFNYSNLSYCCPYCNVAKSDKWAGRSSQENIYNNEGFVDPCCDDYYMHLERDENGKIHCTTPVGQYMHRELKLYLIRHELLYKIDMAYTKQEELRAKIDEFERQGKKTEELNEIYNLISKEFFNYYKLLITKQ